MWCKDPFGWKVRSAFCVLEQSSISEFLSFFYRCNYDLPDCEDATPVHTTSSRTTRTTKSSTTSASTTSASTTSSASSTASTTSQPSIACNCSSVGSEGLSCTDDGICDCKDGFNGDKCDHCAPGHFGYPGCSSEYFSNDQWFFDASFLKTLLV